jgi:hypothetical protein
MIEITKTLNHVDMNIMPYLKNLIVDEKYYKIQNAMIKNSVLGTEKALTHYLGKRDDETPVHYIQIDFKAHDSLYVVIETDEVLHGQEKN